MFGEQYESNKRMTFSTTLLIYQFNTQNKAYEVKFTQTKPHSYVFFTLAGFEPTSPAQELEKCHAVKT
jgi:hypothetical protein